MKSIIWKILSILLILSGFLGYIFFSRSHKSMQYTSLFHVLSILILISGIILISRLKKFEEKKKKEKLRIEKERFILKSDKIHVNFDECQIVWNNYVEEIEKKSKAAGYDALYDQSRNVIRKNVYQAVIIFEVFRHGKKQKFHSQTIKNKDEMTLNFLLKKKKDTFIYVDKVNSSDYIFDIDFLNE